MRVHWGQPGLEGLTLPGQGVSPSLSRGVTGPRVCVRKGVEGGGQGPRLSPFLPFTETSCAQHSQCDDAAALSVCKAFRCFPVCSVSFVFLKMLFTILSIDFLSPRMVLNRAGLEQGRRRQGPRQMLLSLPRGEAMWAQVVAKGGSLGDAGSS